MSYPDDSTIAAQRCAGTSGSSADQVRYEQRSYWRNRGRGVFTFAFPLMFLVIFASLDQGGHISSLGGIPVRRLPRPRHPRLRRDHDDVHEPLDARPRSCVTKGPQADAGNAAAAVGLHGGADRLDLSDHGDDRGRHDRLGGIIIWGVQLRVGALPGLIVTLALGTAAFTTIGIGMAQFIPRAETGPVIVNLIVLPISFISNIWYPTAGMPAALRTIADLFPINALARGLQYAFDPRNRWRRTSTGRSCACSRSGP